MRIAIDAGVRAGSVGGAGGGGLGRWHVLVSESRVTTVADKHDAVVHGVACFLAHCLGNEAVTACLAARRSHAKDIRVDADRGRPIVINEGRKLVLARRVARASIEKASGAPGHDL